MPKQEMAGLMFLDSGAFSQWALGAKHAQGLPKERRWEYFHQKEHRAYLDAYAAFVQEHADVIDYHANVDVIGNPELTWRNQQYLEKKGLKPVPVVHYKTDLKWLHHYLDRDYEFLALGGLVGSATQEECRGWLDRVFTAVCDTPDRLPRVRVHGFGVTGHSVMCGYPWWSVDSASWTKVGAYGGIILPYGNPGRWDFTRQYDVVAVSADSPQTQVGFRAYQAVKARVDAWLEEIGVPYGRGRKEDKDFVPGVSNRHSERKMANLLFFERLRESLPEYPWPFTAKDGMTRRPFGVFQK